jgi:hypothetical protein
MGTILYTRDDEELYDHEGYVAHLLDNGASAGGLWTMDVERRTVAWRAECICGWVGPAHDSAGPSSPSEERHEEILQDWELTHARPLLAAAERVWRLETLADTVRGAERRLRDGVAEAVRRGATCAEIAVAIRMSESDVQHRYSVLDRQRPIPSAMQLGDGPIAI